MVSSVWAAEWRKHTIIVQVDNVSAADAFINGLTFGLLGHGKATHYLFFDNQLLERREVSQRAPWNCDLRGKGIAEKGEEAWVEARLEIKALSDKCFIWVNHEPVECAQVEV